MNIICQSLYYQYILDKFHLLKSLKTFRVIITKYCINSHYVEDNSLKWLRNNKEGANSSISIVLYPVKFIDKVIIVYTLIL